MTPVPRPRGCSSARPADCAPMRSGRPTPGRCVSRVNPMKNRRVILSVLAAVTAAGMALHAQVSRPQFRWLEAGADIVLPREMTFDNAAGRLGILNAEGPVTTKGH